MNSIESLRLDFESPFTHLSKLRNNKLFDDCIFVGSGDSYVAGLIVELITDHRCLCFSPSDLLNSKFIEGKTYCFISVTGKTKANIKIARRAKEYRVNTVAVTLNEKSTLAQICDKTVPLSITRRESPTTGFNSFVANVVTCLQIAGISIPDKYNIWRRNAVKLSHGLLESVKISKQPILILGNNILYAISLYLSLQLAEFFAATAFAHKLEEFCHSPIFGLKKSDSVWILGQNEEKIRERLNRLDLRISYFELHKRDIFTQLFESIFFVQSLLLLLAEKHGYTELQYVRMKDLLKASSDIIYGQSD